MENFDDELLPQVDEYGVVDMSVQGWVTLDFSLWSFGAKLEFLNISGNKVTEIPPEVGSLSRLKEFDLSNNLIHTLPEEIQNLKVLRKLQANGNRLRKLPEGILGCVLLEKIFLNENLLEELPEKIGLFRALRILQVENNQLVSIPPELAECPNLVELKFTNNRKIKNFHQARLDDTEFILWICRHNLQHQKVMRELAQLNHEFELALEVAEEKAHALKRENEKLREENEKLSNASQNYVRFIQQATKSVVVGCTIS